MSIHDLGAVTITAKEVYDKLSELVVAMSPVPKQVEDHEIRLRGLERKIWMAAGFAAAIGTGLGTLLSQLMGGS